MFNEITKFEEIRILYALVSHADAEGKVDFEKENIAENQIKYSAMEIIQIMFYTSQMKLELLNMQKLVKMVLSL